jgi:DNA repair protein RadC
VANQSKDIARYLRYANVVEAVLAKEEFPLYEIKQACGDEKPAFVTRVVKGLERDGVLKRIEEGSKPTFRWQLDREEFSVSGWLDRQIYGSRLTRTPVAERPRERLLAQGAASLRIAELLAILIRSGRPGESALQAGEKIANRFADCLDKLPDAGRGELKSISPAIEQTAYCQIMAGIELGRRVAAASDALDQKAKAITSSEDAIGFCRRHFARLAEDGNQEAFHIVTLNTKHQVIANHQISVGTLDASLVHPREVFRPAIRDAAAALILVHNHPSGDPTPSREDLAVTERLERAASTIDIRVLDHIIVARDGATSIQEYRAT